MFAPANPTDPIRVAVIIGSTRQDRFGPVPAEWIASEARRHPQLDVQIIDLADHDVPHVQAGNDPNAVPDKAVIDLGAQLEAVDAFIVVTPVYNRSYPASLKSAIDWFYAEWALKPVAYVSYGGVTGGLTAIEHLRGVFSEFHAVSLNSAVIMPNFWNLFDHDGRPNDPDELREWAAPMLAELTWWGESLRDARARRPYPGLHFEPVSQSEGVPA